MNVKGGYAWTGPMFSSKARKKQNKNEQKLDIREGLLYLWFFNLQQLMCEINVMRTYDSLIWEKKRYFGMQ